MLENDGFVLYECTPSLFKQFYHRENSSFKRKIRFLAAYFFGYKIYYISKNEVLLGYCVVENGSDIRYKFSTKKDALIGPYKVFDEHRGEGYSKIMLSMVIDRIESDFDKFYAYIAKDNIPSIKAITSVNFSVYMEAKLSTFSRSIKLAEENGDYLIYRRKL